VTTVPEFPTLCGFETFFVTKTFQISYKFGRAFFEILQFFECRNIPEEQRFDRLKPSPVKGFSRSRQIGFF
jgi:hypothetical protein